MRPLPPDLLPTPVEVSIPAKVIKAKQIWLVAYGKSGANINTACKAAGIPRSRYFKWLEEDDEFARQACEIRESVIDAVESVIFNKAINEQDSSAAMFILKTIGKNRGWSERHEVTGANGGAISHNSVVDFKWLNQEFPPDALEQAIAKLEESKAIVLEAEVIPTKN